MSENLYQPPKAMLDTTGHLGPVVLSCRDRSEKERLEALDQGLVGYFLMPLWFPLFPLAILAAALGALGIKFSPRQFQIFAGVIYAAVCAGMYWQLLRRPKKPSLVLHEDGFRFKKTVARFDELTAIRFGRAFSTVMSAAVRVNRLLGQISQRHAAAAVLAERAHEGSVTLVFNTGKTKSLNGMLIRPRPEDLKQFLERLRAMRPGLVENTSRPPPDAPGLDDLPFKMTSI